MHVDPLSEVALHFSDVRQVVRLGCACSALLRATVRCEAFMLRWLASRSALDEREGEKPTPTKLLLNLPTFRDMLRDDATALRTLRLLLRLPDFVLPPAPLLQRSDPNDTAEVRALFDAEDSLLHLAVTGEIDDGGRTKTWTSASVRTALWCAPVRVGLLWFAVANDFRELGAELVARFPEDVGDVYDFAVMQAIALDRVEFIRLFAAVDGGARVASCHRRLLDLFSMSRIRVRAALRANFQSQPVDGIINGVGPLLAHLDASGPMSESDAQLALRATLWDGRAGVAEVLLRHGIQPSVEMLQACAEKGCARMLRVLTLGERLDARLASHLGSLRESVVAGQWNARHHDPSSSPRVKVGGEQETHEVLELIDDLLKRARTCGWT